MEGRESLKIAKDIISQAPNWNFSGDCMLLQWMEQISKNLESRARQTKESLDKLDKNLGRAQISLENTQNSLNALQYTQYVEMRCQDDDVNQHEPEKLVVPGEKPNNDIVRMFLENNLNMLQNCHDRFHFVEDSDEDEVDQAGTGESCIYQPRNPYNNRLLPHIYGTRLWKENWHVGLAEEGTQSYSGDEQSDEYSLSSSSSSMESHNTENFSQWTSSVSLNQESSNYNNNKTDSYVPQPFTSTTSHVPFPEVSKLPAAAIQHSTNANPMNDVEKNLEPPPPRPTGTTKKILTQSKTVNLFDDNDFKSLMSEISEKVPKEQNTSQAPPESALTQSNQPKLDLFARSRSASPIPEKSIPYRTASPQPIKTFTQASLTVNLFDSPTDEIPPAASQTNQSAANPKLNFFSDLGTNKSHSFLDPSHQIPSSYMEKKTIISAKSLFDDDDGDDDFLNIFAKSKSNTTTNAQISTIEERKFLNKASTTLFFDDDDDDDGNDNGNDFVSSTNNRSKQDTVENNPIEKPNINETKEEVLKHSPPGQQKNIFMNDSDGSDEDSIFSKPKYNEFGGENGKNISPIKEQSSVIESDSLTREDFDYNDNDIQTNKASQSWQAFANFEPPQDNEVLSETDPRFSEDEDDDRNMRISFANKNPKANSKRKKSADVEECDKTLLPAEKPFDTANDLAVSAASEKPIMEDVNRFGSSTSTEDKDIGDNKNAFVPEIQPRNKGGNSDGNRIQISSESSSERENIDENAKDSFEDLMTKMSKAGKELLISKNKKGVCDVLPFQIRDDTTNQPIGSCINTIASSSEAGDNLGLQKPELDIPFNPYTSAAYDNFSPLFLDEPPDDDDFIQTIAANVNVSQSIENDFYEPTKATITFSNETESEKVSIHKSLGYNIGLFSEIPPDDEHNFCDISESTPKQSLSESSSSLPSHATEEPPAKEYDDESANKIKNVINKLEQTREMPQKVVTTVSKLKMPNINLNVQALLPNAGAMKKVSSTKESSRDHLMPIVEQSNSISTFNEKRPNTGRENLLPNLCKNRVRGPIKRRASTRAGRQESYQRTLENEQKEEQNEQNKQNEQNEQNAQNPQTTQKLGRADYENNILSSVTLPTVPNIAPVTKLFNDLDDNDDDDDFFSHMMKPKSPKEVVVIESPEHVKNVTQDSDDDLFKSIGANRASIIPKTTTQKKNTEAFMAQEQITQMSQTHANAPETNRSKLLSKKSDTLFGSDSNDDDDGDDLFRALSKSKATTKVLKEPKSNSKRLFSDSEDDDDLFGIAAAKTKNVASMKSVAGPINKATSNKNLLNEKTKKKTDPMETDNPLADLLNS